MTAVVQLGQHELHFCACEPPLVYVRFSGDLDVDQARALAQLLRENLHSRGCRYLVYAAELGTIGPESRRQLLAGQSELSPAVGPVLEVALVGGTLLHKIVLSQIISMARPGPPASGQPHFFDSIEDALRWLNLPTSLLGEGGATG